MLTPIYSFDYPIEEELMNAIVAMIKAILPAAKFIAALTKTQVDDHIVAILEKIVADPVNATADFQAKGAI